MADGADTTKFVAFNAGVSSVIPLAEDGACFDPLNPELVTVKVKEEHDVEEEPAIKNELSSADEDVACFDPLNPELVIVKVKEEHDVEEEPAIKNELSSADGETPYPCTLCDYEAAEPGHLSRHMRTHTGEKPYSCNLCKYKAKERGALTRHMRTHTVKISKNRRKRFDLKETQTLKKLVLEKKDTVENKQSDAVSNSAKKAAWEEIAVKFNEEPAHTKRTVSQLMKCWDNIKTKKKKELAELKRVRMTTGSGKPPITPPSTEEGVQMEALVTNVTNIEIPGSIDSDAVEMTGVGTHLIYMTIGPDGSLLEDDDKGGTDVHLEPELPVANQMSTPNVPSTSSGKKNAPHTLAVAAEIEERARQNAIRFEQASELHNLRLAEAQTRVAIAQEVFKRAQEDLKRAQLETEHKQKLWRMEERAIREKMGWDED